MRKRRVQINIDEIANSLPVDMYFTRGEFCVYTGVSDSSASGRMKWMRDRGYITQHTLEGDKDGCGKDKKIYTMSQDQRFLMIMRAKTPLKTIRKDNEKKRSKTLVKNVLKAELMAHEIAANMALKLAWGI